MKKKPERVCGDCIHVYACSSHCFGNLMDTDATHCVNWETFDGILSKFAKIFGYEKRDKR
jgi:hypothetical protein